MNNNQYLETEFLDIIFQGRNKAYGAYYLRKTYASRIKKSLLSIILISSVGLALFSFKFKPSSEAKIISYPFEEVVDIITIDLPEDAGKHLAGIIPAQIEPVNDIPTEIVPTEKNQEQPKPDKQGPTSEVEPILAGNTGNPSTGPVGQGGTETAGTFPSTTQGPGEGGGTVTEPEPEPEIYGTSEIMPEFPGGIEALHDYLQRNIEYPTMALKFEHEGKVVLNFVVDENGKIANIRVIKRLGKGCDDEAVRVVKSMPRWKPGIQNGKKVKVEYTLPIEFSLGN